MKQKKTKSYIVTCEVDMCAEHEVDVLVTATKESLACNKAVKELLKGKHFFAIPRRCVQVTSYTR